MNSSTRSSGKPNGGAPRGSGGTTSRKSPTKKFGKNLNKLTSQKLSAPPVPVPNSIRGTTSFSGSASSRNGLLLLSTKSSKSTTATSSTAAATNNTAYTPEGARAAGILAPLGRPSTAHDKLLQSAGSRTDAIGLDGTIDKSKSTATPAWGITEKKQSSSSDLPQPKSEAPMLLQAGRPSVPINSSKEVPWSNERLINEPPSIDRSRNNNNNPTMINMERGERSSSSSYRGNYSGDYYNNNNRSTGDYNNFNNRNGDYRTGGDYRNRDSGDYRSGGGDYRSSSRFENRDYNSRPSRYNTGDSYQMASSRYSESSNSREYNNRNGGDTSYQSASRFGSSSRSTSSSGYNNNNDSSLGGDYRSSKRHNDKDNMQQQEQQEQQEQQHHEPPIVKDRFAIFSSSNVVKDIAQNVEKVNEVNPNKMKINTEDNPNWNKSSNPKSPGFWNRYHGSDTAGPSTTQSGDNETTAEPTTADNKPTSSTTQSSGESPPAKDVDQVEYMSKLAKERQEKRRLEEEERMAAQKERAAARLRELEGKRMEEKKKEQQEQSETRKELSKPSMPLEPLGKSKKDTTSSTETSSAEPSSTTTSTAAPKLLTSPKRASPPTNVEKKKVERTLYDPDRPVWGKGGSKTDEQQEVFNTNKSPVHGPSPTPVAGFSATTTDNKKSATPTPIQMVRLSDLRSDEQVSSPRGGAETTVDNIQSSGGGPRLLFDPTSGGMVSASVKNSKQQKRSSKDTSKIISRGMMGSAIDGSDNIKPVRGKQGKGNRKDDATAPPQRNKKRQPSKKRNPRTRGVLYKLDKGGNYMTADGCEPDNGYGSHRVPGGKVKNPTAYAKLMKKKEVQTTTAETDLPNDMTVPTTTTTTATEGFSTATEGFSYRNDPGFIQHQFEAQQQKILEDAWASLVENKDDEGGGEQQSASLGEQVVPTAKSGDDEYAAALAISPSRIGLNFDTNNNMDSIMLPPAIAANAKPSQEVDLTQFAFETTSTTTQQPAANPFASLGTGLWGGGSSTGGATTSTSYGDLGALTGWAPTPFSADTTAETAGQSSKLGLWGSPSALDDVGLGALGGDNKSEETTNGTD